MLHDFIDLAPPRPAPDDPGAGDQLVRRRHGAARADAPRLRRRPRAVVDHDPPALRDRPDRRARAAGRPAGRLRCRSGRSHRAPRSGRPPAASRSPSPTPCGWCTPSSSRCRSATSSPTPPGRRSSRRSPRVTSSGRAVGASQSLYDDRRSGGAGRRRRAGRARSATARRCWSTPPRSSFSSRRRSRSGRTRHARPAGHDAEARTAAERSRSGKDALLWPLAARGLRARARRRGRRTWSRSSCCAARSARERRVRARRAQRSRSGSSSARCSPAERAGRDVRARRLAVAALVLAVTLGLAGLAPTIWVFAGAWAFLGVGNGYANVDAHHPAARPHARLLPRPGARDGERDGPRQLPGRDGPRRPRRNPARAARDVRRSPAP